MSGCEWTADINILLISYNLYQAGIFLLNDSWPQFFSTKHVLPKVYKQWVCLSDTHISSQDYKTKFWSNIQKLRGDNSVSWWISLINKRHGLKAAIIIMFPWREVQRQFPLSLPDSLITGPNDMTWWWDQHNVMITSRRKWPGAHDVWITGPFQEYE